jgi:hypothetical protein
VSTWWNACGYEGKDRTEGPEAHSDKRIQPGFGVGSRELILVCGELSIGATRCLSPWRASSREPRLGW